MHEEKWAEIRHVVRQAYEIAGLNINSIEPGIIPLFDIISAFPLRVSELQASNKRLTYRTAIDFIRLETNQDLPFPDSKESKLSGFLYAYDFMGDFHGWIFTEKNDPTPRRRYSAAHELGHYLLHFLCLVESHRERNEAESLVWTEGLSFTTGNESDEKALTAQIIAESGVVSRQKLNLIDEYEMEREANLFAAELLMPEPACRNMAEIYFKKFGANRSLLARRMAAEFFVSFEAMRWRLSELGLYQ